MFERRKCFKEIENEMADPSMKDGIGSWYPCYEYSDKTMYDVLQKLFKTKKWNFLATAVTCLNDIRDPEITMDIGNLFISKLDGIEINKYTSRVAAFYFYYIFETFVDNAPDDRKGKVLTVSLEVFIKFLERAMPTSRDLSYHYSDGLIYRLYEDDRHLVLNDFWHEQLISTLLKTLQVFKTFKNNDTDNVIYKVVDMLLECCNRSDNNEVKMITEELIRIKKGLKESSEYGASDVLRIINNFLE